MAEKQNIMRCLATYYGIEAISLTFLPIGADQNASVYKAETVDHRAYFVKLKKKYDHDLIIVIPQLLHQAGIHHVILPIKEALSIGDDVLIVYPFIEGQDGFKRELTKAQWLLLGKTFSQIHKVKVPEGLKGLIRHESFSDQWRKGVRSIQSHINQAPEVKLVTFMKMNKDLINRLVDRADDLADKAKKQESDFVLCHGDIHGGNVLIDQREKIYIVDWDDPIMAPKERDLMFIGGGVANVWNKPHEEEWFYEGYGKCNVNGILLSYYRHERILEDIAIYYQAILSDDVEKAEKEEMYKHFISMFEPDGVVDIALRD